jgi:hypothetical protein
LRVRPIARWPMKEALVAREQASKRLNGSLFLGFGMV